VRLSVLLLPESLEAIRSGAPEGALGAEVSTVTVSPDDVDVAVESLSTVVETAVITLSPSVSTPFRVIQKRLAD